MWPHSFKFLLTRPTLIYRSRIGAHDSINTQIFPTLGTVTPQELPDLETFSSSSTFSAAVMDRCTAALGAGPPPRLLEQKTAAAVLQALREARGISSDALCDLLAQLVYLPLILPKKRTSPRPARPLL